MRNFLIIIGFATLGLFVGLGIKQFTAPNSPPTGMDMAAMQQGNMPPPRVSVLEIRPVSIQKTTNLPGRITAVRQSDVRPQVNGIILERLFQEGEMVEAGQQLYQIDDTPYMARLQSARADLQSARASLKAIESRANRYKELVEIEAISRQEYEDVTAERDQARARIAVAEAAVRTAEVDWNYTKVYAPISGRIGRSYITEGALVTANQEQPLTVITQLDPVYVDMQQSANELSSLQEQNRQHDTVNVRIRRDGQILPEQGQLKFSEVTIDESTGALTLRAEIANESQRLLPGLFVTAVLELGEAQNLLVPQRATTRMPDGSLTVWVLSPENAAQPRPIAATQTHNGQWIVNEGLQAGETVIVEGYQKIQPGMTVTPEPMSTQE